MQCTLRLKSVQQTYWYLYISYNFILYYIAVSAQDCPATISTSDFRTYTSAFSECVVNGLNIFQSDVPIIVQLYDLDDNVIPENINYGDISSFCRLVELFYIELLSVNQYLVKAGIIKKARRFLYEHFGSSHSHSHSHGSSRAKLSLHSQNGQLKTYRLFRVCTRSLTYQPNRCLPKKIWISQFKMLHFCFLRMMM